MNFLCKINDTVKFEVPNIHYILTFITIFSCFHNSWLHHFTVVCCKCYSWFYMYEIMLLLSTTFPKSSAQVAKIRDGTADIQKDIRTWLVIMLDACSLCTPMHFISSAKSFHILNPVRLFKYFTLYIVLCVLSLTCIPHHYAVQVEPKFHCQNAGKTPNCHYGQEVGKIQTISCRIAQAESVDQERVKPTRRSKFKNWQSLPTTLASVNYISLLYTFFFSLLYSLQRNQKS